MVLPHGSRMINPSLEMSCSKCRLDSPAGTPVCPRCGGKVMLKTTVRVLGGVLIGLGAFLMGGMAILTVIVTGMIANSDNPKSTTRFNGSESDMVFMYSIFALVFAFGLTSAVAGVWQVIFGRGNKLITWVIFGLAIIFIIAGNVVELLD